MFAGRIDEAIKFPAFEARWTNYEREVLC